MKKGAKWAIYGIFLLALIGLASSLSGSSGRWMNHLLALIFIGGILFFLVRSFLLRNDPKRKEMAAFRKAARLSRKRFENRQEMKGRKMKRPPHRKKSGVRLTVIEGKKGKRENL